jgi:hypothetical protein
MEKVCKIFASHLKKRVVFWDVMPYSSVDSDQHFGRTYCFRLPSRRMKYPAERGSGFPLDTDIVFTNLCGATSQKTVIFTGVRT